MTTLAVFTVKRFAFWGERYWTYGGFGDYVQSLLPHFDRVLLACHPRVVSEVPRGWYPLSAKNLDFFWLPYYEGEAECLLKLPQMFWQSRRAALQADIVNARVPDYSGLCGAFWAKRYRKPMFISHVDNWHGTKGRPTRLRGIPRVALGLHYSIYARLERSLCASQLIFVQGDESLNLYRTEPLAQKCISSSHYGADIVDANTIAQARTGFHIVSVGRLVHVKGHEHLLAALGILRRTRPEINYRLTIAGEGDRYQALKALCVELGLSDCVSFVGQLDRKEIFQLYDEANVFCLSSLREGTPKVILEAMARGVPVVATNVGGVSSVVEDGINGLLVAPANPELLASALDRVLHDEALRKSLAQEGRKVAASHTVEKEWGRMMDVVRHTYPALFLQFE